MNNGGPAFPNESDFGVSDKSCGMSLRDYFAASCFKEIISGVQNAILRTEGKPDQNICVYELAAERAYAYADAMLKERDK